MNPPAWNIDSEYPGLQSKEFADDRNRVASLLEEMKTTIRNVTPLWKTSPPDSSLITYVQNILLMKNEVTILLRNLRTYVECLESVDANDPLAKAKGSEISKLTASFAQVFMPVRLFLITSDESLFTQIFNHPDLNSSLFHWQQERASENHLLDEKEEVLLAAMEPSGFKAWSNLYFALSGTMRVNFKLEEKTETIGIAQASGLTRSSIEAERKAAWQGIQQTWIHHQESASAILNSLAGWRLEIYQKRSQKEPMDFLTEPLRSNRIQRETLTAMMTALENNKNDIQKAGFLMAEIFGKKQLDPWDLLAPAPIKRKSLSKDFGEAFESIRQAFGNAHPEFGDFADLMRKNNWIESRVLPNKANGAYCTTFAKSRTPRVFQTYLGSNHDISTLAHELGHAYHNWVLKDLPYDQARYPMTLAETASIFAETILADETMALAQSQEEKLEFGWHDLEHSIGLLLNIPARFDFESSFYEKRKERTLTAKELCDLTDQAWKKWYGDVLSANDRMYWASKLHFSLAETSFYNFPYTFGYLFGLSIYSRRQDLGSTFWSTYKEILLDTGRMTAEDLIQKHLGEDIRQPEFWQRSIDVVKAKIARFPSLLS